MQPRKRRSIQPDTYRPEDLQALNELSIRINSISFVPAPQRSEPKHPSVLQTPYLDENAFWKQKYQEELAREAFLSRKLAEWKVVIKIFSDLGTTNDHHHSDNELLE